MTRRVAVVTDSTSYLPPRLLAELGIAVVPLHVLIENRSGTEGVDVVPADVVRALSSRRAEVSTSRPTADDFSATYRRLLDEGAEAIVSVHLSAALSGTYDSAVLGARECPQGTVVVIDSRTTAMGLGFAVIAGAEAARSGAPRDDVAAAVRATVDRTTTMFCVETIEHLRRGGRIGAAAALLTTALSVKPILEVVDGSVVLKEKVRTSSRALTRLEELAVGAAGEGPVDLAVQHLAAPERAEEISRRLGQRLPRVGRVVVSEVGATVGAHLGPGVVGVVVVRG
jgi:DegV family protein with EDD domain